MKPHRQGLGVREVGLRRPARKGSGGVRGKEDGKEGRGRARPVLSAVLGSD